MNIEKRVAAQAKRKKIQRAILLSLATAATAGTALVAPNALQLFRHVEKYIEHQPTLKRRVSQAISRLIAKGLVQREQTKNGVRLTLTQKGEHQAKEFESLRQLSLQIPRRWDKKWRIVIFDVWERRRGVRDRLRYTLQTIGFVKIQNSVWVYPYPCEEFFTFLRIDLKLGGGMVYIVAEEIEDDRKLRQHFKLPEQ